LPLMDFVFKKLGFHLAPFRLVTHFISMNAALFIGFFKSMKKVKSGAWERTSRQSG